MTTIEQTGAEEVAWDLSDLYASGDDPRIESDFAEAEAATAAFRDRTYGKVATLSAAELADAITEYERIEAIGDARPLLRAHELLHQHGRPRPRRARREARREGREPRDAAALLRARVGRDRRRHGRDAARGSGARPLAPLALGAARVPSLPADRARGEDPHREGRLRRLGVVAALRGGARRHPRRARGRGRAGRARVGDGEALLGRSRRAPGGGRGGHRGAAARRSGPAPRSSTRSSSTSGSTTGCAATRRGSRRATSPTRRPTTPCRR